MRNKSLLVTFMLIVIFSGVFTGCRHKKAPDVQVENNEPSVKVTRLLEETYTKKHMAYGVVEGHDRITLGGLQGAKIKSILVKEGQVVEAGDILMQLESPVQSESVYGQVKSAQTMVKINRATYDNDRKSYEDGLILYNSGAISKDTLEGLKLANDKSKATYESAISSLKQAQTSYEDLGEKTTLEAPFSGTIVAIEKNVGDISTGKDILISKEGAKKIVVTLPSDIAQELSVNQLVDVLIDEDHMLGHIESINGEVSNFGSSVTVMTESDVETGAFVYLDISYGESISVFRIPVNALVKVNELDYVFLVENDQVKTMAVKVIAQDHEMAIIESFKTESGALIVDGQHKVVENMPVSITD